MLGFHNASGIATQHKRKQYVRRMVGYGGAAGSEMGSREKPVNKDKINDSEYAASMVQGKWKQKKNKELIERVRKEYVEVTGQIHISWEWVKGHSNNKWNDRADELADQGAHICEGKGMGRGVGRGEETQDEQTPLKESEACMKGEVKWVTYRPTEATRILRSRTRHGCLNRSALRQRSIPRGEVNRLEKQSLKHVLREARMGLLSWLIAKKANEKLERAGKDQRYKKEIGRDGRLCGVS